MSRTVRRLLCSAAMAGALGLAVPGGSAVADEPLDCPRIAGICVWSEPEGEGELRLVFRGERVELLDPPGLSVQNQTEIPWCLHEAAEFGDGPRRTLAAGETVRELEIKVQSLYEGSCYGPTDQGAAG
ncbi:hypothetical protein FH609_027500 [Streptomyces sp. 3MP-14]|uniref:Proteinase inhibitor I36 SMPI n=1 Tax=Streptomyces mimosae TaxID=2586635 RepID=A0A5N5ZZU0_9ACTN|nr:MULTISPECIES: hypothetical protein [Streptomyces]KAB8161289.1 hypothetical protein FH607_025995 [Streptomyces mimosae]KAB8173091.1 hypothetical protein FH609_027500 [Streptomyces sp. 3MP-14]